MKKVRNKKDEKMSDRALSQKPFGFRTNFIDFSESGEIKLYNKKAKSGIGFVKRDSVVKNASLIDKWKVVTSRSTSVPEEDNGQVLRIGQTFISEPGSVVTESYVVVDVFDNEDYAINCLKYLKTKFFRMLCQVVIVSPDVSSKTFELVPIQDFSKESDIDWSKSIEDIDNQLATKYGLDAFEREYISNNVRALD